MIILGLSCLEPSIINHDATAALLIDGRLSSAVTEDRFTKVKHHYGYPAMSIKSCLDKERLRLEDVDRVVVGYGLLKYQMEPSSIRNFVSQVKPLSLFKESPMRLKTRYFMIMSISMLKRGISFLDSKEHLQFHLMVEAMIRGN